MVLECCGQSSLSIQTAMQFSSLRVDLNSGEVGKDITVSDNPAEFLNLDCNRQNRPRVRAVVPHFAIKDHGTQQLYIYGRSLHVYCNRFNKFHSFITLKCVHWTR